MTFNYQKKWIHMFYLIKRGTFNFFMKKGHAGRNKSRTLSFFPTLIIKNDGMDTPFWWPKISELKQFIYSWSWNHGFGTPVFFGFPNFLASLYSASCTLRVKRLLETTVWMQHSNLNSLGSCFKVMIPVYLPLYLP